ncbi:MAG: hypothetical protein KatS3mg003_1470 [Candidatus Nitrosocaldaceae archaeon]|nr:MAG: hypothetical protein KatS3mg003_1470 [Candidatus Nitrosocaldaceae archaeon]
MNKRSIIKYSIIVVIASIIIIYAPSIYTTMLLAIQVEPSYEEPDMTLEEYNIKEGIGSSSIPYYIMNKESVEYSIRGEVIDVRKPIIWIEKGGIHEHAIIPVDILIKEVYKGDLKKGDIFTLYVDSIKSHYEDLLINYTADAYYIPSYEARYKVGEEVIVHISKEEPDIFREAIGSISKEDEHIIDEYYYTTLGKYSKYTIKDNLAYNEEKYPYGVPIPYVAYEALP